MQEWISMWLEGAQVLAYPVVVMLSVWLVVRVGRRRADARRRRERQSALSVIYPIGGRVPTDPRLEYQRDLRAMAEGAMSLDQFTEKWRDRLPRDPKFLRKKRRRGGAAAILDEMTPPKPEIGPYVTAEELGVEDSPEVAELTELLKARIGSLVSEEIDRDRPSPLQPNPAKDLWDSVHKTRCVWCSGLHDPKDCPKAPDPDTPIIPTMLMDGLGAVAQVDFDAMTKKPYRQGQWLRHKNSGNLMVVVSSVSVGSVLARDSMGEYAYPFEFVEPAMPKKGEWWQKKECATLHGGPWDPKAVCWTCDEATEGSAHLFAQAAIDCGCLIPVAFGKGTPVAL